MSANPKDLLTPAQWERCYVTLPNGGRALSVSRFIAICDEVQPPSPLSSTTKPTTKTK